MKIKEITVKQTVNLGSYENVCPSITVQVGPGDVVQDVFDYAHTEIIAFVNDVYGVNIK